MPSHLRIVSIAAEGFRGFNEKREVRLDSSSAILCGPNGSGKTSILQAAEWGLYGHLRHMAGAEFEREDAIVNQFQPEREARVSLTLSREDETIRILRTRRKEQTSRRKSKLQLLIGGASYEGEEAESKLQQLLGLNEDEFYSAIYLHQEAVRDFVSASPADRSGTIDRMLGTYTLRELTDSLPIMAVTRRKGDLRDELDRLAATIPADLVAEKERLKERKDALIKRGVSRRLLEIDSLPTVCASVYHDLAGAGSRLRIQVVYVEPPTASLSSIQQAASKLREQLSRLERERFEAYRRQVSALTRLGELRKAYADAWEKLKGIRGLGFEDISRRLGELRRQLEEKTTQFAASKKLRDEAQGELVLLTRLEESRRSTSAQISAMEAKKGTQDAIDAALSRLAAEIQGVERQIERTDAYSRLIGFGWDYIETHKPTSCPICNQTIDPAEALTHLRREIEKAEGMGEVPKLSERIKELHSNRESYESSLSELRDLQRTLESTTAQIDDALHRVMRRFGKLGITNSTILEAEIESLSKRIAELVAETSKLADEVKVREQQITSFNQINEEVERLAREAQSHTASAGEGRQLLTALDRKIRELEDSLSSFDHVTKSLEKAKSDLGTLDELLGYQTELYELSRIEATFPETQSKMNELKTKIEKLGRLEQALTEIKEAAVNVQTELATNVLKGIQGRVGETYAKLIGHPYYNRLTIAAEVSRGRNVYWITAEGENYVTYIQTRFSTAQLNMTALALFLTISKQLPHNLGFIILDDPTQSMDTTHTEALARALAEEMNQKQVVIATHDGELARQLEEAAPSGALRTVLME